MRPLPRPRCTRTARVLKLERAEPPGVNGVRLNRQAGAGIAALRPLRIMTIPGGFVDLGGRFQSSRNDPRGL